MRSFDLGLVESGWLPNTVSQWLAQTYTAGGAVIESFQMGNGETHTFEHSDHAASWGFADLNGVVLITMPSPPLSPGIFLKVTVPAGGPVSWS